MLQLIYESSVKVRLLYAVHSYLSIMQWELHKGEASLATEAFIVLSKLI